MSPRTLNLQQAITFEYTCFDPSHTLLAAPPKDTVEYTCEVIVCPQGFLAAYLRTLILSHSMIEYPMYQTVDATV